ncbi:hypothetical protein NMY22_g19561 [Coprinellus aureogranulatus]|nr:hypothetical protein NMY22_g19561 [Coprinellus aureogranulatus]
MVRTRASYTDLPFELREQILAYCERSSLVALSATTRAFTSEAEAMLYETVSLHETREYELSACLRTLTGSRSRRKAQFVRTFAVTFVQKSDKRYRKRNRKHLKTLFGFIQVALRRMTGLRILSVWPPEDVNSIGIEQVLRYVLSPI